MFAPSSGENIDRVNQSNEASLCPQMKPNYGLMGSSPFYAPHEGKFQILQKYAPINYEDHIRISRIGHQENSEDLQNFFRIGPRKILKIFRILQNWAPEKF